MTSRSVCINSAVANSYFALHQSASDLFPTVFHSAVVAAVHSPTQCFNPYYFFTHHRSGKNVLHTLHLCLSNIFVYFPSKSCNLHYSISFIFQICFTLCMSPWIIYFVYYPSESFSIRFQSRHFIFYSLFSLFIIVLQTCFTFRVYAYGKKWVGKISEGKTWTRIDRDSHKHD